jgi:hypothetical protein
MDVPSVSQTSDDMPAATAEHRVPVEPDWRHDIVDGKPIRLWPDPCSGGVLLQICEPEPIHLGHVIGLDRDDERARLRLEPAHLDWGLRFEDALITAALNAYNDVEREMGRCA